VDEAYFTTLWFLWEKAMAGFWGRSLMEQALPSQVEINRILARIEKAQRLMCAPKVGVARARRSSRRSSPTRSAASSSSRSRRLSRSCGPRWRPRSTRQLDAYIQKIYDLRRRQPNASAGQKEADLESGEALRASLDIQQARMALIEDRWERFHVERHGGRDRHGPRRRQAQGGLRGPVVRAERPWDERRRLERDEGAEDSFALTFWPSGILPITPAGRIDTVKDPHQLGDLVRAARRRGPRRARPVVRDGPRARREANIERQMEGMLYDGEQAWPDESTDIQQAIGLSAKYVNSARARSAPPRTSTSCAGTRTR